MILRTPRAFGLQRGVHWIYGIAVTHACSRCGHRQDNPGDCGSCGEDTVHDLGSLETRRFFRDIEMRRRQRYEARFRWIGVVSGMVFIIALWFVPGWWELRRRTMALPLLIDQMALMAVVAFGVMQLLQRTVGERARLFPWLVEEWEETPER